MPTDTKTAVFGYALSMSVHQTEAELRLLMPLLGERLKKPNGFLEIASSESALRIPQNPRCHRRGEQNKCGQCGEDRAHPRILTLNSAPLNLHGITPYLNISPKKLILRMSSREG